MKKTYYAAAGAAAIVIVVIAAFVILGSAPVVQAGDVVQVYYTGSFQNGTVFGSNVGQQPIQFTVGANQMISGFDQAVVGMRLNQTKNVTLPPSLAYGNVNPNLIITVPIAAFGNQTVKDGMPVTKNANGQQLQGVVTQVNSTNATVDFNPPLAGKTLYFSIRVVKITK